MFPVFSNLSDLSQKESKKERQNIEVKRTKTKSLVAQTSVTKKKKKKLKSFCSPPSSVVERWTFNPMVVGSIPTVGAFFFLVRASQNIQDSLSITLPYAVVEQRKTQKENRIQN